MKVINNKDNFEATMRKFKKKVLESGRLQEYRERQEYEKPSIARKIAKGKAISRWKKYIKSQELPTKLF